MESRIVNLDTEEGAIISVTYNGERKVLTRSDVVELLGLRARMIGGEAPTTSTDLEPPPKPKTKTLASIGAILGPLLRVKVIAEKDQERLLVALKNFDGDVGGRRSSQVAHWLRDVLEKKLSAELRAEIISFLKQYPELEKIPRRQT